MLGIKVERKPITGEYAEKLSALLKGNMKTKEERAKDSVYRDCDTQEYDAAVFQYLKGATEQKEIERKALVEIYHLYSALIDDLYDAYNDCNGDMGVVGYVNGEEKNMAEMLDKLDAIFREALNK